MKFTIEQYPTNAVTVWLNETTISAAVYCGENQACKTEADAREAAELLRQFFEAKEAGKVVQLIVNDDCHRTFDFAQRPKNTVIDQMNENAEAIASRIWGNRAHDMTLEQYEVFTIAHNAAMIFAHNAHDIDERRAVQSAAKILRHAKQTV